MRTTGSTTAALIAWTIRARLERYGINFLPVDTLDIENLADEIAANLADPPLQFREPFTCPVLDGEDP